MNTKTQILLVAVALSAVLVTSVFFALQESPERTFEENEKIIAAAIAAREAQMTPDERVERDAAKVVAAQTAAREAAESRAEQAKRDFLPAARGACLLMLKQTLHDPGSAEFGLTSEWPSSIGDDGNAHILARLRAKNSFGALTLANYICVAEPVGADNLRVVKLDQLP